MPRVLSYSGFCMCRARVRLTHYTHPATQLAAMPAPPARHCACLVHVHASLPTDRPPSFPESSSTKQSISEGFLGAKVLQLSSNCAAEMPRVAVPSMRLVAYLVSLPALTPLGRQHGALHNQSISTHMPLLADTPARAGTHTRRCCVHQRMCLACCKATLQDTPS